MTLAQLRELVDRQRRSLSIVRQCALLGVSRSSLYYRPRETSQQDLSLMQAMDRKYLETPFYGSRRGSRRMKASLTAGHVGKPEAGVATHETDGTAGHLPAASHQPTGAGTPGLSLPSEEPDEHPGEPDPAPAQAGVWAADITYLPMARGFQYLVVIMDWHSRYVVAWRLSNMSLCCCPATMSPVLKSENVTMVNRRRFGLRPGPLPWPVPWR